VRAERGARGGGAHLRTEGGARGGGGGGGECRLRMPQDAALGCTFSGEGMPHRRHAAPPADPAEMHFVVAAHVKTIADKWLLAAEKDAARAIARELFTQMSSDEAHLISAGCTTSA